MSYESPIKLITDLEYKIIEDQEQNIYKAVCSYCVDISKNELFKLLYDDRKQYDKGYSEGYAKATTEAEPVVRCKDCKWYEWGLTECHNPRYGDGWANYPPPQVYDEYFCKDGEREVEE